MLSGQRWLDIWCGWFELPLEREGRAVGVLHGIIHSVIVYTRFPFGCLDITADTDKLIVHVVPVMGGVDVRLHVGEVP